MPCFPSSNRICSLDWAKIEQSPTHGQLGASLLTLVSTVAMTVIFVLQPTGTIPAMITLGTLAGSGFLMFAISSYIDYRAKKQRTQDEEERRQIMEFEASLQIESDEEVILASPPPEPTSPSRTETLPVERIEASTSSQVETHPVERIEASTSSQTETHPVEITEASTSSQIAPSVEAEREDPIRYLVDQIFPPIFVAFEKLITAVIFADCKTTGREIDGKPAQIKSTFKEGAQLFNLLIEEPELYLTELLRYFGRGKDTPSVALRRLVAAYNSGNPEKYQEMLTEYRLIKNGHDFRRIAETLRSSPRDQEILRSFPQMLESRFCLDNDEMKRIGLEILNEIFSRTAQNTKVLNALKQLKAKAKRSDQIVKEVEKFVSLVFKEARISKAQMNRWNQVLVREMLETQFKKTTCHVLGMMARNIRILRLMFDKSRAKEELFPELDTTFLLSETSQCILREQVQKRLFQVQSEINFNRKDKNRIALLALTEGMNHSEVEHLCRDRNQENALPLSSTDRRKVDALKRELGVEIIDLPISISDHPFKHFKNHETAISWGAWCLKPFLPKIMKPKLMELVPKLGDREQRRFDRLFDSMLHLLIDPIYDGAIGNTEFREPFERIITTRGEELAEQLERLVASADQRLSFKEIQEVWIRAVNAVTQEFLGVVHKNDS